MQAYWQIVRIIVKHEQNGSLRAEYGKAVLQEIAEKLQQEFGGGFFGRNLQQMKKYFIYAKSIYSCWHYIFFVFAYSNLAYFFWK